MRGGPELCGYLDQYVGPQITALPALILTFAAAVAVLLLIALRILLLITLRILLLIIALAVLLFIALAIGLFVSHLLPPQITISCRVDMFIMARRLSFMHGAGIPHCGANKK